MLPDIFFLVFKMDSKELKRMMWIALGGLCYSFFMNIFIVPVGLYSGGFMGVSQIIRTVLTRTLGLSLNGFDFAGIINYCFNIPLYILAFRSLGRKYVIRSFFNITMETVFLSLIPVPQTPIITDMLASAIIGGAGCGLGGGLLFRNGANGGGMDMVSALFIKKYENMSIGIINNTVNIFVFGVMLFMFGPVMVIYSVISSFCYPIVADRVFVQNINMEVHVIVDKAVSEDLCREIMVELNRGVTKWSAIGAYTGSEKEVIYIVLSKYELSRLISICRAHDSSAMIIQNQGAKVNGSFEKRIE